MSLYVYGIYQWKESYYICMVDWLSGFVKSKFKSRLLTNLLKFKNLEDIGGVSL